MIATALLLAPWAAAQAAEEPLELRNARWFDGEGFVARTVRVEDGRFVAASESAPPARALDLGGGFVIPPFAEAHNHNVHDGADATLARYLDEGVFYVKNPNSLARTTTTVRAQVNRPDAIDVVFAGGGLTSTGGHPIDVVEPMVARGIWSAADGDGGFYFALDDAADVAATWPAIRAQPRDFLKTYLLYSEEHARWRDDESARGWRGLDPGLLPDVVRRAHAEGWRVSTHVESAADFRAALAAGADEINHLPGFRPLVPWLAEALGPVARRDVPLDAYRLTDADARRAAEQGTVVVTTVGALLRHLASIPDEAPERAPADALVALVRDNLEVLRARGVRLALGSDEYDPGRGVVAELLALERLALFEPAELLRIACEQSARAIFPERRIGRLEPGCEASFLVLDGDPLADPERVRHVRLRVKQGRVLAR